MHQLHSTAFSSCSTLHAVKVSDRECGPKDGSHACTPPRVHPKYAHTWGQH